MNPFDDEHKPFFVLINDEGQHSLWPDSVKIPSGWHSIFGPAERRLCLDYIKEHWIDMRPKSLIRAMNDETDKKNGDNHHACN